MPSADATPARGPAAPAATPGSAGRSAFSRAINLFGAVVVLGYLVAAVTRGDVAAPAVGIPLASVSVAAWASAVLVPLTWRHALRVLLLVAVVAGAGAVWSTDGLTIVPVIACVLRLASWDEHAWTGGLAALLAGGLIAVGAIAAAADGRVTVPGVLALEAGVLVAVLGGSNRRQARARDAAALEAAAQSAAARVEQARAAALAQRQTLARDLHDVLAHSLGGLVIQLDAAAAQLEAGRVPSAPERLQDARQLAASGLAEARRAVEALHDDGSHDGAARVPGAELTTAVGELVEAHRRLGGTVELVQRGEARVLRRDTAVALRRAAQESLSNARAHAPGAPVSVREDWSADRVELTVRNPLTTSDVVIAASGTGRGLAGMRARFAALPGGEATWGERDGTFEVRVAARTEGAR
ncbi:sensor histidine kinase [Microbacterium sp.]|uniref:sensor histidine kinase n=1 Tax=Microbacterium sp. TaxID=51671 RepID=UPI0039E6774E